MACRDPFQSFLLPLLLITSGFRLVGAEATNPEFFFESWITDVIIDIDYILYCVTLARSRRNPFSLCARGGFVFVLDL